MRDRPRPEKRRVRGRSFTPIMRISTSGLDGRCPASIATRGRTCRKDGHFDSDLSCMTSDGFAFSLRPSGNDERVGTGLSGWVLRRDQAPDTKPVSRYVLAVEFRISHRALDLVLGLVQRALPLARPCFSIPERPGVRTRTVVPQRVLLPRLMTQTSWPCPHDTPRRDRGALRHFAVADSTSTAGEASAVGNAAHTPLGAFGHDSCFYKRILALRLSGL